MEQSSSIVEISNGEKTGRQVVLQFTPKHHISTHMGFSMEVENKLMKYTIPSLNAALEGFIYKKKISLTIYNAGLNDSGQYSCVLNTSHGLTLKNVSVRVVANANGKFIYLLNLPGGILFFVRALRFLEHP